MATKKYHNQRRKLIIGAFALSFVWAILPTASAGTRIDSGAARPWPQILIRAIQEKLAALGFDPGPADGIYGPRTAAAIAEFQASQGIRADGKISEELLHLLEL